MSTKAPARVIDVLRPPPPSTTMGWIEAALREGPRIVLSVGVGKSVDLPPDLQDFLLRVVREAAAGHTVQLAVRDDGEIGTTELASMLAVSRPTAVTLLDQGLIPSRRTPKGHRKVRVVDAEAFIRGRETRRASIASLQSRAEADGHPMFWPDLTRQVER